MKKLLFFAAFAVFTLTANAQASFGAKAGVNFSSINGDDAGDIDGRTSFHVGGVVNITFSEIFGLQPEVVFSSQGYTRDIGADDDVAGRLNYVNIPVMADITIVEGLSLQGGPQFGINVSADEKLDGETFDIPDIETLDIGVCAGAQFKMENGLFFQARYVIGLSEIVKDFDSKNSVVSFSVGWFFN